MRQRRPPHQRGEDPRQATRAPHAVPGPTPVGWFQFWLDPTLLAALGEVAGHWANDGPPLWPTGDPSRIDTSWPTPEARPKPGPLRLPPDGPHEDVIVAAERILAAAYRNITKTDARPPRWAGRILRAFATGLTWTGITMTRLPDPAAARCWRRKPPRGT